MNKRMLIVCILVAIFLSLLPITSVIGINVVKSNAKKCNIESPLFATRVSSIMDGEQQGVTSSFIGKGRFLNLFITRQSSTEQIMNRAVKLIKSNPKIMDSILEKFNTNSDLQKILIDNDVDVKDLNNEINQIKNDPSILLEKLNEYNLEIPTENTPQPLGLSTSSALGCFIIILVLLPIFLSLGVIIATITIITCLNIGGCFETLLQNLLNSFTQGFTD